MPVRAVLFDIGGILELTPDTGWRAKWEARHRLNPGEIDDRLMQVWKAGAIGTLSEAEVESRIVEILGFDAAQLADFMHDIWEDYLGQLNHELAAYFAGLRPRYITGIISNSFVGATEREQERYGFADLCDMIIYSHEVGLEKPDPRIFHLTCERLGIRPDEAVFLDDVEGHVEAARAVGMRAVLFKDNAQAIAEIEAHLSS